ncbi:THAP domain-containing protein 1-like [Montipora foliosa]|uniref:THAP domain-containing protein 1-like n=1 Tax=Montipora foliosa TaxID=591990 RepID=UPI0035F15F5C
MVYCAAFDCNNDSRFTTGISYRCFPSEPSIREQWLAKISRADSVISKHSRLCSEYFTPDCYERDLKAELLGSKVKAILKPNSIPSLFSQRSPPKKPRLSSERRSLEKTRQEDAMRVRDFSGEILEYKNDPVTEKQVLVWKAECGSKTRQGDPKAHTTENECY